MSEGMSVRALPSTKEALLYLRNNGLRRTIAKMVSGYVVGRQRWHLTREDLTRYAGRRAEAPGLEFRFARLDDVPRMQRFHARMLPGILRLWYGPDYFFFLTLEGGEPISYRCLSTLVHPGVVGFIRLRPEQIFMVDEFTSPPFRRRGITRQMTIAMTPFLLERGFREVLGIHRVDNHDTIAAAHAKGIPRIGTVTRSVFLWKTVFTYQAAPDASPAPAREPAGPLEWEAPKWPPTPPDPRQRAGKAGALDTPHSAAPGQAPEGSPTRPPTLGSAPHWPGRSSTTRFVHGR